MLYCTTLSVIVVVLWLHCLLQSVRWQLLHWRDNIIIIGGLDKNGNVLNTVVSYNVKEQKSKMLPSMKQKRRGCTAVVTDNVIIVMGGWDEKRNDLNSVECFNFYDYVWEDFPSMKEQRFGATAVVKYV